jgi:hypothetical protein
MIKSYGTKGLVVAQKRPTIRLPKKSLIVRAAPIQPKDWRVPVRPQWADFKREDASDESSGKKGGAA